MRRTEKEQQKPERTASGEPAFLQGSVDGESFPRCVKEEKEDRTDREADRGRLEAGGQDKRGEWEGACPWLTVTQASRIPCPQGHRGSSQEMRREHTSRQPPTTSSDNTATRRGPPR